MLISDDVKSAAKVGAASATALVVPTLGATVALAEEGGYTTVLSALTGSISVSTVMGVVAAGVTASVGLAFAWWAARKVTRTLMSAFRRGKVSV